MNILNSLSILPIISSFSEENFSHTAIFQSIYPPGLRYECGIDKNKNNEQLVVNNLYTCELIVDFIQNGIIILQQPLLIQSNNSYHEIRTIYYNLSDNFRSLPENLSTWIKNSIEQNNYENTLAKSKHLPEVFRMYSKNWLHDPLFKKYWNSQSEILRKHSDSNILSVELHSVSKIEIKNKKFYLICWDITFSNNKEDGIDTYLINPPNLFYCIYK